MENQLIVKTLSDLRPKPSNILDFLIGFFTKDLSTYLMMIKNFLDDPTRISDALFYNNFILFLEYGFVKDGRVDYDLLRKLSAKLEEEGNSTESAIRIIKAINYVDTKYQIAVINHLTQSLINGPLTHNNYFKLIKLVSQMTNDDILYLKDNITKETFVSSPKLDDFIVLGLVRNIEGGYIYTERAFDILEFGISYGHSVSRPEKFEERPIYKIEYDNEESSLKINTHVTNIIP